MVWIMHNPDLEVVENSNNIVKKKMADRFKK